MFRNALLMELDLTGQMVVTDTGPVFLLSNVLCVRTSAISYIGYKWLKIRPIRKVEWVL